LIKNLVKYNIIFIFSIFSLFSQRILSVNYNEESGPPSSTVYSIVQDELGYMYFTTRNGLARYSGTEWKIEWNTFPRTQAERAFFQKDELGNIWIFTLFKDKILYKKEGENWIIKTVLPQKYVQFYVDQYLPFSVSNYENKFRFLVYSKKSLVLFKDNQWNEINIDTNNTVYKIVAYKGIFYLATKQGIYTIGDDLKLRELSSQIPKDEYFTIALETDENSLQKIWFASKGVISYFDSKNYNVFIKSDAIEKNNANEPITLIPNYYRSIIFGNLRKILLINKQTLRIIPLGEVTGIIEGTARDIYIDREYNIWIVNDRGITKIPSLRFVNYDKNAGLLENEVTSIVESKGIHYIGHNNGISIGLRDNTIKHIVFSNPTQSTRVLDMDVSPFGEVYAAVTDKGLFKISKDLKLIPVFLARDANFVQSVIFDKNGKLYFCTTKEIYSKSINEINFKLQYKINDHIRKLFIDNDNNLWASTITGGVIKFDDGNIISFKSDNVLANSTTAINFDLKDTVLVGTNKGLYFIDKNKLKPYWLKIERPIYFIKKYYNYFWIGTDGGVYRWDGKNLAHFAVQQGLSGLETNRDACYLDAEGNLWIGTNRGLTRYNYHYDYKEVPKPIVVLKNLKYSGTKELNLNAFSKEVSLSHNNNNFYFNVDILSFIDENNNFIQYKLEGRDNDWSEFKKNVNLEILYRTLPPGNYKFKVRAKNALGIHSDVYSSPDIIIEKPFYQSWTFILLIIIISIVVLFLIIKYVSNWQYKNKLEEEIKLRTKQLIDSEARYKQMFIDNNAYMIFYDAESGIINEANPSSISYFGFNFDDIGKIKIFDLLQNDIEDKSEFLKFLVEQKEYECTYKIANNQIRNGIIHQSKIKLNEKCYIYAIIEDITERKKAQEELKNLNLDLENKVIQRTNELEKTLNELKIEIQIREKTEKELFETNERLIEAFEKEKELGELKSRFISMISHEYRTPLTVILSSAYLIKESLKRGLEEEVDKHLHKIHSSVTTMSRLLEDVLTYGKAEEGALPVRLTDFSLREFLLDVIEEASITDQKQHNVVLNIPDYDCRILSDKFLLRQIVLNILSNSMKYSDKGTNIFIDCWRDDGMIKINIKDEGKGISDDELEHIFEPFYRNKTAIGITPGIGIGLAIAKRCIDVLQGKIEVNNKFEKGVQFSIILPTKSEISSQ